MRILVILIPISLILLGVAIWAFIWAVRRGQFDDLDTPALDVLADEERPLPQRKAGATPDSATSRHPGDGPP